MKIFPDKQKNLIILTAIMILIPAFYAYSRDFSETKYLYALFPIFSVIGCFTFKKIFDSFDRKKKYPLIIGVAGSLGWRKHHYEYMKMYQKMGMMYSCSHYL